MIVALSLSRIRIGSVLITEYFQSVSGRFVQPRWTRASRCVQPNSRNYSNSADILGPFICRELNAVNAYLWLVGQARPGLEVRCSKVFRRPLCKIQKVLSAELLLTFPS